MPSIEWCIANTDRVRWALGWVERRTQPIARDRFDKAMALLAATTGFAREDDKVWEVRSDEYFRLLGCYSPEVWAHAVDKCQLGGVMFPKIAELEAIMKPKDAELRTSAYRLRKMLQAAETGKCQPPADDRRYDEMSDEEKAALDAMLVETKRKLAMGDAAEGGVI